MTHAMTLRLDDALYETLRLEAFDRRMPISDVIRERLAALDSLAEDKRALDALMAAQRDRATHWKDYALDAEAECDALRQKITDALAALNEANSAYDAEIPWDEAMANAHDMAVSILEATPAPSADAPSLNISELEVQKNAPTEIASADTTEGN